VAPVALFLLGYMSTHPLDVRTRELVSIYDLRPAAYHALAILPTSDARFWHHTPISQLLKIHDHEGNRGYHMIRDIRHALLLDNELHSSNDNKGITEGTTQCADFPNNHMERTELVNRLFDAMVNLDDILEDENNYKVQGVTGSPNVELLIHAESLCE
jgi:hypothetical protein